MEIYEHPLRQPSSQLWTNHKSLTNCYPSLATISPAFTNSKSKFGPSRNRIVRYHHTRARCDHQLGMMSFPTYPEEDILVVNVFVTWNALCSHDLRTWRKRNPEPMFSRKSLYQVRYVWVCPRRFPVHGCARDGWVAMWNTLSVWWRLTGCLWPLKVASGKTRRTWVSVQPT